MGQVWISISEEPEEGLRLSKDRENWRDVFHLRLSSEKGILEDCGMKGLSCANQASNEIFLNVKNWVYGTRASGMGHEGYIVYQILHEASHLLGRGHNKWPNNPDKPCPLNCQQTVKPSAKTCYPNVYPLQSDYDL